MKLLLAATMLLTACDDPGTSANTPDETFEAGETIAVVKNAEHRQYDVLRVADRKLDNVCYVVLGYGDTARHAASISCMPSFSDDKPACTPPTTVDGIEYPGECPADFEGR